MDEVELSFRYYQPILLQAGIVDEVELSFRYYQPILLQAGIVDEVELSSIGGQYLKLSAQLCAPDDGRRNRPKHVEPFRNK